MKTVLKQILSKLAFSHNFYQALEKTYNFLTYSRFNGVSRSHLEALYDLITTRHVNRDFRLIRVGSSNDGGYLMFKPMSPSCTVVSLGIADNMDFEIELVNEKLVSAIFCFDGSIARLPEHHEAIDFKSKFIKVNESENSLSLSQVLAGIDGEELILKIDIEGDEWDVLDGLTQPELNRFSQIIGEFHGLGSCNSDQGVRKMADLLQRISIDFHLVNSHANNWASFRIIQGIAIPDVVELTFIRKNIFQAFPESAILDNSHIDLNAPCNPSRPDYLFK